MIELDGGTVDNASERFLNGHEIVSCLDNSMNRTKTSSSD